MAMRWLGGKQHPPNIETTRVSALHTCRRFLQAVAAEFIGTFFLVFLGVGSVTSGCHQPDADATVAHIRNVTDPWARPAAPDGLPQVCLVPSLRIASAFSCALALAVFCTAAISGGCINPAVTLACFLKGALHPVRALCYIIAQCLGASAAAIALELMDPVGFKAAGGGANAINKAHGMTKLSTLGVEITLTFILVFTVLAATETKRHSQGAHLPILAPLAVGSVAFCAHIFAIPLDGCSINPARSLGPALVAGAWKDHWVFWAGPCSGAVIAVLAFELIFKQIPEPSKPQCEDLEIAETGIAEVGRRPQVVSVANLTAQSLKPADLQSIRVGDSSPSGDIPSWKPTTRDRQKHSSLAQLSLGQDQSPQHSQRERRIRRAGKVRAATSAYVADEGRPHWWEHK